MLARGEWFRARLWAIVRAEAGCAEWGAARNGVDGPLTP
jgi:hypothetical protein